MEKKIDVLDIRASQGVNGNLKTVQCSEAIGKKETDEHPRGGGGLKPDRGQSLCKTPVWELCLISK